MPSAPFTGRVDPRESYVDQVFSHLARAVLVEQTNPAIAEQQLWRLPDVATQFVYNAVTEPERLEVAPIVHRLRKVAIGLIDTRLDRSAAKAKLADRVAAARAQIQFRPWRADEGPILRSLLDNERVWAGLPDRYPGPMTDALTSQLISIANGWSVRHSVQLAEWRGQPIGQARLQFDSSTFPDAAEISYWLGERFWGHGLATHVVTLFTAECFRRWPAVHYIFANVLDHNHASIRVLEKAGYRHESFHYHNVTKDTALRSTYVLAVCRCDYVFPEPVTRPTSRMLGLTMGLATSLLESASTLSEIALLAAA